jgi:acyl-CoA synthetase (AMP-forming)/AMP-acid ligase II
MPQRHTTSSHERVTGWLDDPRESHGVRFRRGDGSWQRFTYRELAGKALGAGAALAGRGVRPGDVVPLLLPTSVDFVAHFFGLLSIGATPSVLPLPGTVRTGYQDHIGAIVASIRPRHAIVAERYLELVSDSITGAELIPPAAGGRPEDAPRAAGELAMVQFTSGSRGRPRGLRISMANLAANTRMIMKWTGMRDHGVVSWLPLYHDMGLVGGMLTTLTSQLETALMPPEQFLRDTAGWLAEYGHAPYETIAMPNFGFERVLARITPGDLRGLDFSAVTTVISGAERVDPAVLAGFARLLEPSGLAVSALKPAYGLAEGTLAVAGGAGGEAPRLVQLGGGPQRLGEKVDTRRVSELGPEPVPEPWLWHVSCGRPLNGLQVEILDERGDQQPEGVLGEIAVSGPSVADGYIDPAAADADKLSGGRLYTGDAGFMLDGELYVIGRMGDSVKVNGQSVFVEDVELELVASTAVSRNHTAVVAGLSDGVPTLVAISERAIGDAAEVAAVLRSFAGDGGRVEVVRVKPGTIPFTSSHKPRRRALWLAYLAGELPRVGEPEAKGKPA